MSESFHGLGYTTPEQAAEFKKKRAPKLSSHEQIINARRLEKEARESWWPSPGSLKATPKEQLQSNVEHIKQIRADLQSSSTPEQVADLVFGQMVEIEPVQPQLPLEGTMAAPAHPKKFYDVTGQIRGH